MRPLLAGAAAAALLFAPAAGAATNCFGAPTAFFCLTTPDASVTWQVQCVYLGGTQCTYVRVPSPKLSGSLDWYCGGTFWTC